MINVIKFYVIKYTGYKHRIYFICEPFKCKSLYAEVIVENYNIVWL
jgi:hypothetical protein